MTDLFSLPALKQRRAEILIELNAAKAALDDIDQQIAMRCEHNLKALFSLQGKQGGTVTGEIEGIKVKGEVTKTVNWDTDKLREVTRHFSPEQFNEIVTLKLSIPEKVYGSLPDGLRAAVDTARSVQYGDLKVKIED